MKIFAAGATGDTSRRGLLGFRFGKVFAKSKARPRSAMNIPKTWGKLDVIESLCCRRNRCSRTRGLAGPC
jgi:hypothetical protein